MADKQGDASQEEKIILPEPDKGNSEWFTRSADPDPTKLVKGD